MPINLPAVWCPLKDEELTKHCAYFCTNMDGVYDTPLWGVVGALGGLSSTAESAAKETGKAVESAAKETGKAVSSAATSIGKLFGKK